MAIGLNVLFTDEYLWANRNKVGATGRVIYKPAGVTIDWSTIAAVSGADVVLPDGQVIKIGEKYIRYGTIIYKLGNGKFGVASDVTTLVPGETFIMDYTITDQDITSPNFGGASDNMSPAFKDRVLAGGAGQPAWDDVYSVLSNVTWKV